MNLFEVCKVDYIPVLSSVDCTWLTFLHQQPVFTPVSALCCTYIKRLFTTDARKRNGK